jgi:hypothetical protein
MILCAAATAAPLILGLVQNQIAFAVYGAIMGYLVALNDHFGQLKHRLLIATFTYTILILGFVLGAEIGSSLAYGLVFAAVVYWLGVLAGQGAELERAILFAAIGMIIAHSANKITPDQIPVFMTYIAAGWLTLMIGIPVLAATSGKVPKSNKGLGESFKKSMTLKIENHIHAASYTLTTLFSVWLTRHFAFERGYWITVTILLVMKPDRTQSIYVTLQRLVGTLLGVLLAETAIHFLPFEPVLVFGVFACAAFVPWAVEKNYALVAFFATVMVVCLLELTMQNRMDTHLPIVRLKATLIGCALSIAGTSVSKILDAFLGKST